MQVLIAQWVVPTLKGLVDAEPVGELHVRGLTRPVKACNIVGLKA